MAQIGETKYTSLSDALTAVSDGGTIEILADCSWTARMGTTKTVTIQLASGVTATISMTATAQSAQVSAGSGKTVTFDGSTGTSLTIDANGNTRSVFETSGGTFVLKSVTLQNKGNATSSEDEGYIHMKSGSLTLNNVTFSGTGNAYNVRMNTGTLTLVGSNTFSSDTKDNIYFGGSSAISVVATDATLSSGSPIGIGVISTNTNDHTITGGTATANFSLSGSTHQLVLDGSNVIVQKKPTAVYNATTGTWYASFETACSAASSNDELQLNEDIALSSRQTIAKAITIKPYPAKSITIKRNGIASNNCMMIQNPPTSSTLTFDGSGGTLTIDDNNNANTSATVFEISATGKTEFKNLTIQNSGSGSMIYQKSSGGAVLFSNVTFSNCKPTTYGAMRIHRSGDYAVELAGAINFTGCTGTNIWLGKSVGFKANKDDNTLTFTTTPVTVTLEDGYASGNAVITNTSGHDSELRLTNAGYLLTKGSARLNANYVSTSYDLTIGSAGMATLVLPFNVATLPTGASSGTIHAYKLTTTSSVVSASEVTSITKDEPVLIGGTADTYTFTGAATADYSTSAPTNGALIGTYKAIDADNDNYVLQNGGEGVGFYKLASTSNHVINPFRAYLSGDANESSPARLAIVFDDSETNGISNLTPTLSEGEGAAYSLTGQRVIQPIRGLYIVNGKKVIIK